jgi:hypothetical protein
VEHALIERIDNHVEQGLARLISQYQNAVQFKLWISVYLRQIQRIEDGIWEVIYARNIDSGIGVQLDLIGKILNRARGGLSDDDYRIALRAEIAILRSTGTANDLETVGNLSLPSGYTFTLTDEGNAALLVQIDQQVLFSATTFLENLIRAKQGGVKLLFEYSTNAPGTDFTWTDGPGWDDGLSNVGGLMVSVQGV